MSVKSFIILSILAYFLYFPEKTVHLLCPHGKKKRGSEKIQNLASKSHSCLAGIRTNKRSQASRELANRPLQPLEYHSEKAY